MLRHVLWVLENENDAKANIGKAEKGRGNPMQTGRKSLGSKYWTYKALKKKRIHSQTTEKTDANNLKCGNQKNLHKTDMLVQRQNEPYTKTVCNAKEK